MAARRSGGRRARGRCLAGAGGTAPPSLVRRRIGLVGSAGRRHRGVAGLLRAALRAAVRRAMARSRRGLVKLGLPLRGRSRIGGGRHSCAPRSPRTFRASRCAARGRATARAAPYGRCPGHPTRCAFLHAIQSASAHRTRARSAGAALRRPAQFGDRRAPVPLGAHGGSPFGVRVRQARRGLADGGGRGRESCRLVGSKNGQSETAR